MKFDREGSILSIFFCEFHSTKGPQMTYQYPNNKISKEFFDIISVYMIPKHQMSTYKKIITLNQFGHKVIGFPNEIKSGKYERNVLIFNLCFVFASNSRTAQYEPVVKKLSEYLENLELEYGFLSDDKGKQQLPNILRQVFLELNENRMCTIKVDLKGLSEKNAASRYEKKLTDSELSERKHSLPHERRYSQSSKPYQKPPAQSDEKEEFLNPIIPDFEQASVSTLHLKVIQLRPDPAQVQGQQVPLLVCTKDEALRIMHQWDLTTQQILCYIDGVSHVSKIAADSEVHITLVKSCIQNLMYYGAIKLLPIFQYSNVYTVLPGFHKLYSSKELQEECIKLVAKSNGKSPTLHSIMEIYGSMKYGVTIRDLCIRFNPCSLNIDERRLVQFGLLNGFIERLHQYPIRILSSPGESQSNIHAQPPANLAHTLSKMCDGAHSLDAICCVLGMSTKEIVERIERDPNIVIIWKAEQT